MGTVTTLPRGRAYTRQDLATMPDDGRRYELVDGTSRRCSDSRCCLRNAVPSTWNCSLHPSM